MGLFHFLIVVQGIIAAALVGVILMQRSEGGGLGMGGSPAGLLSARGAADFLTRTTTILATLFILLSISLAFVAAREGSPSKIDDSLQRTAPTQAPAQQAPANGANPAENPSTQPKGDEVPLDK
jgi:preprotein translocase subunit SecG